MSFVIRVHQNQTQCVKDSLASRRLQFLFFSFLLSVLEMLVFSLFIPLHLSYYPSKL